LLQKHDIIVSVQKDFMFDSWDQFRETLSTYIISMFISRM